MNIFILVLLGIIALGVIYYFFGKQNEHYTPTYHQNINPQDQVHEQPEMINNDHEEEMIEMLEE